MDRDMKLQFEVKMQARQARRSAAKASKELGSMLKTIQAAVEKGDMVQAERKTRAYLLKKSHAEQLDEIADQMEQAESQITTNIQMKKQVQLTARATKVMAAASRGLNPQQTIITAEQYKEQNEAYSMNSRIMQDAMKQGSSAQVNEDAVHEFLAKMTDAAGVKQSAELNASVVSKVDPVSETAEPTAEMDQALQERLRILREQPEGE